MKQAEVNFNNQIANDMDLVETATRAGTKILKKKPLKTTDLLSTYEV